LHARLTIVRCSLAFARRSPGFLRDRERDRERERDRDRDWDWDWDWDSVRGGNRGLLREI